MKYDVIIIGSGAGGSAAAYQLVQSGARVLLLEKGTQLPRDGSTLNPDTVMRRGAFLSDDPAGGALQSRWQDQVVRCGAA